MPLITGSVFLAGALLSCLLPIGLLIAFATYFYRQTRRLPGNVGVSNNRPEASQTAPPAAESPAAPSNPYADQ